MVASGTIMQGVRGLPFPQREGAFGKQKYSETQGATVEIELLSAAWVGEYLLLGSANYLPKRARTQLARLVKLVKNNTHCEKNLPIESYAVMFPKREDDDPDEEI